MPEFDTVPGNWLCLDFTHTLTARYSPDRQELLHNYNDLLAWGLYMRLLTEEEERQLLQVAERHPLEAAKTLENAIRLREAVYRMFYAISEDTKPQEDDMALLNATLARAMSHACILMGEDNFTWDWFEKSDADRLERLSWLVVRSAADLLTSEKLHDVRACAADDCRWLFLDISKNHSRRWCDMQTCGNQAKARKHYSRKKSASTAM